MDFENHYGKCIQNPLFSGTRHGQWVGKSGNVYQLYFISFGLHHLEYNHSSKWQGLDSWTESDNSSPSPSSQKIKVRVWRCQFAEGSYNTQQVLGPSTQELDAERSEVQGHLSAIYIANFRAALDTRETISQKGNKWKHFFKDGNKPQAQPSRYFYPDLWILCIHIPSERNDMEQSIPP